MQEPDLSAAVALVQRMAARDFDASVEGDEVEAILRAVLYEPRELLRAAQIGLVTRTETASAVAAHIHRWLMDRSGRAWGTESSTDWDEFIRDLETTLFSPT